MFTFEYQWTGRGWLPVDPWPLCCQFFFAVVVKKQIAWSRKQHGWDHVDHVELSVYFSTRIFFADQSAVKFVRLGLLTVVEVCFLRREASSAGETSLRQASRGRASRRHRSFYFTCRGRRASVVDALLSSTKDALLLRSCGPVFFRHGAAAILFPTLGGVVVQFSSRAAAALHSPYGGNAVQFFHELRR